MHVTGASARRRRRQDMSLLEFWDSAIRVTLGCPVAPPAGAQSHRGVTHIPATDIYSMPAGRQQARPGSLSLRSKSSTFPKPPRPLQHPLERPLSQGGGSRMRHIVSHQLRSCGQAPNLCESRLPHL